MKIYQVDDGWNHYYTIDKSEAYWRYNNSGDANKGIIEYDAKISPALLIAILNLAGVNLAEQSHDDLSFSKYVA